MNDNASMSVNNFKKFKLVFLGSQNVGKSSVISRYVYDSFETESNPTIGVDFVVKSVFYGDNTYKIHFWDTAGQEKFKSLIPSYIKDCQIAVLVYDITNRKSFEDISTWYESIRNERGDDIIVGLLANKIDLKDRVVSSEEGLRKAEAINALYLECSAKTGENLQVFFKMLLETVIKEAEEEVNRNGISGLKLDELKKVEKKDAGKCC
jgi:Ras-related protein Rab-6A